MGDRPQTHFHLRTHSGGSLQQRAYSEVVFPVFHVGDPRLAHANELPELRLSEAAALPECDEILLDSQFPEKLLNPSGEVGVSREPRPPPLAKRGPFHRTFSFLEHCLGLLPARLF